MIGYLSGKVISEASDYVILLVNGVGYKVFMPVSSISDLRSYEGDASLFITTIVREDAITLYGFITEDEQKVFEQLMSVSGVGAKSAASALSAMSAASIVNAIMAEDINTLSLIPGVGKKTAQRIILELKDKFANNIVLEDTRSINKDNIVISEAIDALVGLGYNKTVVKRAVDSVCVGSDTKDVSTIIRKALSVLSKGL